MTVTAWLTPHNSTLPPTLLHYLCHAIEAQRRIPPGRICPVAGEGPHTTPLRASSPQLKWFSMSTPMSCASSSVLNSRKCVGRCVSA